MINEEPMVRSVEQDDIFSHLRKQDENISSLREEMAPALEVINNLRGFSNFCTCWGRRLSIMAKWLATVGPGAILAWQWITNWSKTKNGG